MKTEFKKFHIGYVVSITTGIIVSRNKMESILEESATKDSLIVKTRKP